MKTLHFDCFAGISGDMTLGALADLGVEPEALRGELRKLGLSGWDLTFSQEERCGITGTRAVVALEHEHHEHREHPHHHEEAGGEYRHRTWKTIRALISDAPLKDGAKARGLAIFERIARAEAQVHGTEPENAAFHEVGALDSIIDIMGAAIGLDMLKPDRITCGEIELGGGTVWCAHGELPVPAPATLLLVQGLMVRTGGFQKEMTTPTGAAILASSVDACETASRFQELRTGYGIGQRKLPKPNVLRLSLRETPEPEAAAIHTQIPWLDEELTALEANIDDMTGEELGFLMERLFEAGALDVTYTPCVMKKSRPGTIVSVLGDLPRLPALRKTLFQHSSTSGFRETRVRRLSLPRREERLSGSFGEARQKTVFWRDEPLRSKIEYEDRARLAREQNIPLEAAEQCIQGKPRKPL
ncbi:MAG: nickel pincer cofactor biosynthesis protein LarC [Spirochaetaceae bacterium]|jgi:uncharacterized protein (TIGR00299 family) protein|nr:nickel pincer cofactor biosynthesis protein LarC [Spirochaetaceae bacterium]